MDRRCAPESRPERPARRPTLRDAPARRRCWQCERRSGRPVRSAGWPAGRSAAGSEAPAATARNPRLHPVQKLLFQPSGGSGRRKASPASGRPCDPPVRSGKPAHGRCVPPPKVATIGGEFPRRARPPPGCRALRGLWIPRPFRGAAGAVRSPKSSSEDCSTRARCRWHADRGKLVFRSAPCAIGTNGAHSSRDRPPRARDAGRLPL